jgi:hypothetical protein
MKKLILALLIGLAACAPYPGQADYAYYHYSCVYHCDTVGGCRTTCGNHYYSSNGMVYYYDADHQKWDGMSRYQDQPQHRNPSEKEPHGRAR